MERPDTDVVAELLEATDARRWDRVLELTSEDIVAQHSSGRLYVGRSGFSKWLLDSSSSSTARWFHTVRLRALGDGFVLVVGAEHRDPIRGTREAVPGAWIHHVRDGRVTAVIYYRTERQAMWSLAGPRRGELTADLLERFFDAFNRNDRVALVSMVGDGLRFSAATVDPGTVVEGVDQFVHRTAVAGELYDDIVVDVLALEELRRGFCVVDAVVRTTSGSRVTAIPAAWLVRVADDRIAEMILHPDVEGARKEALLRLAEDADPAAG